MDYVDTSIMYYVLLANPLPYYVCLHN